MAGVDIVRMMQTAQSKASAKAAEQKSGTSKTAFSSLMQEKSPKAGSADTKQQETAIDPETQKAASDEAGAAEKSEQKEDTKPSQPEKSEQTISKKDNESDEETKQPELVLDSALWQELQSTLGQWMTELNPESEPDAENNQILVLEQSERNQTEEISGTAEASTERFTSWQVLPETDQAEEADSETIPTESFFGMKENLRTEETESLSVPDFQEKEPSGSRQVSAAAGGMQKTEKTQSETVSLEDALKTEKSSVPAGEENQFLRTASGEEASEDASGTDLSAELSGQLAAEVYSKESGSAGELFADLTKPTESVRTTPQTFAQDIGTALAQKLPSKDGVLELELEPASLGKLTLKVMYEGEKATVSILTTNPKTLELLSHSANEIAQILKTRTGQETEIYTPQTEQQQDWTEGRNQEHRRDSQEQERKQQDHTQSFAQQLRLGLV